LQNKIDMNNGNERANEISGIPRILGDAGKSKEVSRVFAALLCGRCYQGNESQGTVQNHWLASVEYLARKALTLQQAPQLPSLQVTFRM